MKRIEIITKDGKNISLFVQGISSLEEVDTITVSDAPDREIVSDTDMNEQPENIDYSNEQVDVVDDVPTVSEPPVEEVIESVEEVSAPVEEITVEPPVDASADKSVIDDIVGLVTAEATVVEDAVANADEPAEVVEIPNAQIDDAEVVDIPNAPVEVVEEPVKEEPKKEPVVDAGFTMV